MIYNIIQAYTQFKMDFNSIIIYYLSFKLKKKYFKSIILYIIKLLYNLVKVKKYLFLIYLDYYRKKLDKKILFHNKYLSLLKTNIKTII